MGMREGVSLKQQEKVQTKKSSKNDPLSKGGKPMAKGTLKKLQKLYD